MYVVSAGRGSGLSGLVDAYLHDSAVQGVPRHRRDGDQRRQHHVAPLVGELAAFLGGVVGVPGGVLTPLLLQL